VRGPFYHLVDDAPSKIESSRSRMVNRVWKMGSILRAERKAQISGGAYGECR
jgi:hypothetical protein